MKRIGTVVRIAQGMLIARSPDETIPEVGDRVVDEALDSVGRVVDVIGPVARPFVVIDPDETAVASLLNQRVYLQ
jgi:RNA-binding protein